MDLSSHSEPSPPQFNSLNQLWLLNFEEQKRLAASAGSEARLKLADLVQRNAEISENLKNLAKAASRVGITLTSPAFFGKCQLTASGFFAPLLFMRRSFFRAADSPFQLALSMPREKEGEREFEKKLRHLQFELGYRFRISAEISRV